MRSNKCSGRLRWKRDVFSLRNANSKLFVSSPNSSLASRYEQAHSPLNTDAPSNTSVLFQVAKQAEEVERRERELEAERRREVQQQKESKLREERERLQQERRKKRRLERQEKELREKILRNMRIVEERQAELQRENLRRKIAGSKRLQSVMVTKR